MNTLAVIAAALLTFLFTVLSLRKLIPWLKGKKLGQVILDIGPRWHKGKEGTPTMGGLSFFFAAIAVGAVLAVFTAVKYGIAEAAPLIISLAFASVNGAIGIIDDSAKLRHHANEGLTAPQKYLLQLCAAAIFLACLRFFCGFGTELAIPFFNITVDLGFWYYPIALLLITGIVNAVNLTDGIDGLAASVTLAVGAFFTLVAYFALDRFNLPLAVEGVLTVGACAGFLVYNFYPARVFMGDTGSLFLGGLVIGCAFTSGNPLIILPVGVIYVTEAASDILQVGYFKLSHGKRLFKMAPIHHHFEKCGWSEIRIVITFTFVTVLFSLAAWFGL